MPLLRALLVDLEQHDIQAILTGLDELPGKFGRQTFNKVERQINEQVAAHESHEGDQVALLKTQIERLEAQVRALKFGQVPECDTK